jgi:hypothetical protein
LGMTTGQFSYALRASPNTVQWVLIEMWSA